MNPESDKRKSKPSKAASAARARTAKKPADPAPPSASEESAASRPSANGMTPSREERGPDVNRLIEERAYRLYLSSGCQHGHALEHWLEAEHQVMVSLQSERGQSSEETSEASRSR